MHRIYLAFGLGSLLITCLADPLGGQQVQGDSPAAVPTQPPDRRRAPRRST